MTNENLHTHVTEQRQLDTIDGMVYSETVMVRRQYEAACRKLGLTPRKLTPPVVGMRSVTP